MIEERQCLLGNHRAHARILLEEMDLEVGPSVIESLRAAMLSKRRFGLFEEARPVVGLASGVDALDQKLELLTRPPVAADGRIAMHPRDIVAEAERSARSARTRCPSAFAPSSKAL